MLSRWTGVVQDDAGSAVAGASIEVRSEATGALVPVYADRDGLTALGNPFVAADATFAFHVIGGAYRIVARSGPLERVWRFVAIGTAQEYDIDRIASLLMAGIYPAATLAALNAYVPGAGQTVAGLVLNDPSPANNGYYVRSGSAWARQRGLPDTLAVLQVTGGSANAIQAGASPGVDPALVAAFVIDLATANTGPVTLSVNGGQARPVLDWTGAPMTPGYATGRLFLTNGADAYREIVRPGPRGLKGDKGDRGPAGGMDPEVYDPEGLQADAFARGNHTGTQPIAATTGLQAALNSKEPSRTLVAEALARAGTDAAVVAWSALRVAQAADGQIGRQVGAVSAFAKTILDDATGGEVFATIGASLATGEQGVLVLPNGFRVHWGYYTSGGVDVALTFHTAFPTACVAFVPIPQFAPTNTADAISSWTSAVTRTSAGVIKRVVNAGTVNGTTVPFRWVAIGY